MALITRLSRLFQADFHAVLDQIEEPDIQLKQAIREMQFDLQQDEQQLALLQQEIEQLSMQAQETQQQIGAFDNELDLCFRAEKDELARDLIRRKLEVERRQHWADKQHRSKRDSVTKLTRRVGENRELLQNMQQKLELWLDDDATRSRSGVTIPLQDKPRSEEIEIAFLREKNKRVSS